MHVRFTILLWMYFVLTLSASAQKRRRTNILISLIERQRKCFHNAQPCVMILNEKGSAGCGQCGSSLESSTVKQLKSPEDLLTFIPRGQDVPSALEVILTPESLAFSRAGVMRSLQNQGKIVGAVVIAQQVPNETQVKLELPFQYPPLRSYSGDQIIPNNDYLYTVNQTTPRPRNPAGLEVQHSWYPYNVFYVRADDASLLRDVMSVIGQPADGPLAPILTVESSGTMAACAEQPSSARPSESPSPSPLAQNSGRFSRSTNSKDCLDQGTCKPIGGYSVWSSTEPLNNTRLNATILAVTAPMDSSALFRNMAYGAAAEVASVAALMAVVKSVSIYRRRNPRKEVLKYPMFFAFNAQAWGFTGSGRFLEDMLNFECKTEEASRGRCIDPFVPSLKFQSLRDSNFSVINLGPLVSQSPDASILEKANFSFFLHGLTNGNEPGTGGKVEDVMRRAFNDGVLNLTDGYRQASFADASQSFQHYLGQKADVVTLANFQNNYTNLFYHSPYDNATLVRNETRKSLHRAAMAVAKAVIMLSYGEENPLVSEEPKLIDDFIDCLTSNWDEKECPLAKEYMGEGDYNVTRAEVKSHNYAGVFVPLDFAREYNGNNLGKAQFLQTFMAYHNRIQPERTLLGDYRCLNTSFCNSTLQTQENLNANISTFRPAFCARGECVLAESHLHAAFGTGLTPINQARTNYTVRVVSPRALPSPSTSVDASDNAPPDPIEPDQPAWTESSWNKLPEMCYNIQDTRLFGGLVLGAGLIIFASCMAVAVFLDPKQTLLRKSKPEDIEVEEAQTLAE